MKRDDDLGKLTEIYAFVTKNELVGGEDVIHEYVDATNLPIAQQIYGDIDINAKKALMLPFVCTDKKVLEILRERAEKLAKDNGHKIKIIKFIRHEEIEEIG